MCLEWILSGVESQLVQDPWAKSPNRLVTGGANLLGLRERVLQNVEEKSQTTDITLGVEQSPFSSLVHHYVSSETGTLSYFILTGT